MAVKKSELYSSLWESCNQLRGGMDASQYKDYVLVVLFVKYISDRAKSGEVQLIDVPEGASFDDLVNLKGKSNIGEEFNKILNRIAEENDLDGVINVADFNDEAKLGKGKDLVDTVSNLIGAFQKPELDFVNNRADNDDLLGDAYEYLMKNFASESGKSKGQFYTPAEVSRIMAKVIGIHQNNKVGLSIYDPTCGSGSLLLRAWHETLHPDSAAIFGQEKDINNVGMAKMNMILHGYSTSEIKQGDTLNNPQFVHGNDLDTFDYVVANPPFSQKSWLKTAKMNDIYGRWGNGGSIDDDDYASIITSSIGVPPEKNGDYAFLLHIIRSLKSDGKGACILPHGVLFRGNAEGEIRKNIIDRGYVKGIIGLPVNLFYGTGIPACIIILDKEDCEHRKGIFMIDAKAGFVKDGNMNRLREQDIQRIVDTWNRFRDVPHYAHFATNDEIIRNDYNLNIPRYIESKDEEIQQDIEAHLHGGIPAADIDGLQTYWDACPSLKTALVKPSAKAGYYEFIPKKEDFRTIISDNADIKQQEHELQSSLNKWFDEWTPKFQSFAPSSFKPKEIIDVMGETMLQYCANSKLVDNYDVYDQLMNYWLATMQDDFYLICADGWELNDHAVRIADKKGEKKEKTAKTIGDWECDLLPVACVVKEYFEYAHLKIEALRSHQTEYESECDELCEEQVEGYFNPDNFNDSKINRANVKKRLKDVVGEEKTAMQQYLDYQDEMTEAKKEIAKAEADLLEQVKAKYQWLRDNEPEVKRLVIQKWTAALTESILSEMQRIVENLNSQVTAIAERYEQTLAEINSEVSEYESKVMQHLEKMGFKI
jgi:type I restriction enzyme M protein